MMKKINCGLCSFGMSGRVFHAPLIHAHPGFELKAVLERTHNNADKIYPGIKTFRTYDDLLEDQGIELVIVNLPDHLHFDFSKKALEAGKNVIVEKPFTITVKEGQELIDLAGRKNLGLFVYQNRRWDSDFLTVRKLLDSGYLGRVVEYEAHFDRFRPDPPKDSWKEDEKLGTGLIYNLGSHLIDQALVLFGWPEAVFADIQKLREGSGINDYFNIILYYPGLRAILRSSYIVKKEVAKYIIHGDKGTFLKSGSDPQEDRLKEGWMADDPRIGIEPEKNWGIVYNDSTPNEGSVFMSLSGNYLKFYDGIQLELNGKPGTSVSGEEGLNVVRIIEAALESSEKGHRIMTFK